MAIMHPYLHFDKLVSVPLVDVLELLQVALPGH